MWRIAQEPIAYELVLSSLAVSRMSGSSKLDSFVILEGGQKVAVLWSVASLQDLINTARSILS